MPVHTISFLSIVCRQTLIESFSHRKAIEDCFAILQSHSTQSKASGAFEGVGSNSFLKCKSFIVTYKI